MTNHLRFRDTDDRFRAATDAQLAVWEAVQPQRPAKRQASAKDIAGLFLAMLTIGLLGGVLLFGWLQGLWG